MTPRELAALRNEGMDTASADEAAEIVNELVNEVERLRGLIKSADGQGDAHGDVCPWCRCCSAWSVPHVDECPAFTADGEVK